MMPAVLAAKRRSVICQDGGLIPRVDKILPRAGEILGDDPMLGQSVDVGQIEERERLLRLDPATAAPSLESGAKAHLGLCARQTERFLYKGGRCRPILQVM
jgi:hypothetical protein